MEPDVVNVGRHKDLTTETGPTGVEWGRGSVRCMWVDSGLVEGVVVISFQFTSTLPGVSCMCHSEGEGTLGDVRASYV